MKTYIYFVRHAQPDISIREDLRRPLTEQGIEDAKKVTKALMNRGIAAAYSSPYRRAVDTIQDFADNSELEIIIDNDLCERRVGEWVEDFIKFSKRQWEDFDFKLLGGESLREVQERNVTAIFNIIKDNVGKSVVIGTHGTALSTIINYYNSDFGHADFLKIVDKMPYILCFKFSDIQLESIEEIEI